MGVISALSQSRLLSDSDSLLRTRAISEELTSKLGDEAKVLVQSIVDKIRARVCVVYADAGASSSDPNSQQQRKAKSGTQIWRHNIPRSQGSVTQLRKS